MADPTSTKEYKEMRARFDKRQASGHWTGKTKKQRDKEKREREAKKNKGTVARGIGKLGKQGRELDKYVEMLKEKPMATVTEIFDQYARDSRYGTSSKVPQAGKKKTPKISNGGTAALNKKDSGSTTMNFKKLFSSF